MSSYYEKILATGEVKCIDDEIPFDIPQGWEWCRMGAIGDWGAGATPNKGMPQYYGGNVLWLRTGELNESYIYDTEIKLTPLALKDCSLRLNQKGDVLIAMYGATIGKVAVAGTELTTNQACCACTPILVYNEYLFYFLMGSKDVLTKKGEGGAQPNISREKLISHLMPIPPLNEQFKIVNCIKRLIPTIKSYENLNLNLQNLNNSIKDILKKSILQEAIQGRLVTQIESDGTAEELLDEIRAEKQRLVKEGKLKKSALTNESRIFKGEDNKYFKKSTNKAEDITDKIPFDIPKNWRWCRLETIIYNVGTKMNQIQSKEVLSEGCIPVVSQSNKLIDGYCNEQNKAITDLPLIMFGDHTRQVKFIDFPFIIGADGTKFHKCVLINPRYLYYWMTIVAEQLRNRGYARHYSLLKQVLVPLPPLKEQHRIVNKLDVIVTSIMSR